MKAGVAVVDITPDRPLPMSGFAARTEPSRGAHDPLTARALVVEDTALVVVDVIGRRGPHCARPRARRAATAEHHLCRDPYAWRAGVDGELAAKGADPAFLQAIEDGCVRQSRQRRPMHAPPA